MKWFLIILTLPLYSLRPYKPITPGEKHEIEYIVTTLAEKSTPTLLFYKSSLTAAGDRVDHVHPYRFMHAVFSDEELKVAIRNIIKKDWVWSGFVDGFADSFNDELALDNLHQHTEHFCSLLQIDPPLIAPYITTQNWEGLIIFLMHHIPRQGDFRRYDF